jgi:hypothetical protein
MLLPLNFIPVIGTPIFLCLQGKNHGPSLHRCHFQLKGMNEADRDTMVQQNRAAYTA